MADPQPRDPSNRGLLVWALAAFHTGLPVVAAVGALYGTGVAGDVLAGLSTALGAVAYLYLWAVTWWTTRGVIRDLEGQEGNLLSGDMASGAVGVGAAKWGALAGVFTFLPLLVVGIALFVGAGGLDALSFLAVGGTIGALLAAVVGAVIGVTLAAIDLALVRAARAWIPPPGSEQGRDRRTTE